jgi:hypothetical protein
VTNLLLLAADMAEPQDWLHVVARPEVLIFCIPIVAIAGGIAFAITKAIIAHKERMAKIQQGIDPDAKHGPG